MTESLLEIVHKTAELAIKQGYSEQDFIDAATNAYFQESLALNKRAKVCEPLALDPEDYKFPHNLVWIQNHRLNHTFYDVHMTLVGTIISRVTKEHASQAAKILNSANGKTEFDLCLENIRNEFNEIYK